MTARLHGSSRLDGRMGAESREPASTRRVSSVSPTAENSTTASFKIDDARRRFRYERVQSLFPVQSYLGTVEVRDAVEGRSEISWTVVIEAALDVAPGLADFPRGAWSDGIESLERDLRDAA